MHTCTYSTGFNNHAKHTHQMTDGSYQLWYLLSVQVILHCIRRKRQEVSHKAD